jgi:hypothetical protein
MITQTSTPNSRIFSQNPVAFTLNTDNLFSGPSRRPNFRIVVKVQVETVFDSGDFDEAVELRCIPDDDGNVEIDLSPLIHAEMVEMVGEIIPAIDTASPYIAPTRRNWRIAFAESYGAPPVEGSYTNSDVFKVYLGGVSKWDYPFQDYFDVLDTNAGAVMSWTPAKRWVSASGNDYIPYYCSADAATQTYSLQIVLYYTDGTFATIIADTLSGPSEEIIVFPTGIRPLALASVDDTKKIRRYDATVLNGAGSASSPTIIYYVDNAPLSFEHNLVFVNSFWQPSGLRMTGKWEQRALIDKTESNRILKPDYASGGKMRFWHASRLTESLTCNTGPITKADAVAFQDALLSGTFYLMQDSDYKVLLVQDKELKITEDWEDFHALAFKALSSFDTLRYSGVVHQLAPSARWALIESGIAGNQNAEVAEGTELTTGTMQAYLRGFNPDGTNVTAPDYWKVVVDLCDDTGATVELNYAWAKYANAIDLSTGIAADESANWGTDVQPYLTGDTINDTPLQFAKKLYSNAEGWRKCDDTAKSLKFRLYVAVNGRESQNTDNVLYLPWHLEQPQHGRFHGADSFVLGGYLYIMWYDRGYGTLKLWRNDGLCRNVGTLTATSSHGYLRVDTGQMVNGWPVLYAVKGDCSIVTQTAVASASFCGLAYGNETTIKAAEAFPGSFMFTIDTANRHADTRPRLYFLNNDGAGEQGLFALPSSGGVWGSPVSLLTNVFTATGGGYTREMMRCDEQGYVWVYGSGSGSKKWKCFTHTGAFSGWATGSTHLSGADAPFAAVIINHVDDGIIQWPEFFEGTDRETNSLVRYDTGTTSYSRIPCAASGTSPQGRVLAIAYHDGIVYHGCWGGGGDNVIMAYDIATDTWSVASGQSGISGNLNTTDY